MSYHDECVKEMFQSLSLAGALTMIIFAFIHTIFGGAGEVLAFFAGTELILTYCVWTVIDLVKKWA